MTEKNTNVKNNQVQPATVDRLSAHEDWTFTDANGYEWKYRFQFPGLKKAY